MNKYIYIIGTICVLFLIGSLFVKLLPYLIIAGVLVYLAVTIKGKIESAKEKKNTNNTYVRYNNDNDNVQDIYNSSEDYTNGEIIDVDDYEDVDKK